MQTNAQKRNRAPWQGRVCQAYYTMPVYGIYCTKHIAIRLEVSESPLLYRMKSRGYPPVKPKGLDERHIMIDLSFGQRLRKF